MIALRSLLPAVLPGLLVSSALAQDRPGKSDPNAAVQPPVKMSKLEAAFSKKMTNATLVGSFTIDGKNAGKPPKAERYELGVVKKVKPDTWLWVAKIKYGNKEGKIPFPITLTMKWAGDTPVITLTNFKIPAMGTFTARVLFYKNRYVGTWQHGKVGGHMFGRIEPAKRKSTAKDKSDK